MTNPIKKAFMPTDKPPKEKASFRGLVCVAVIWVVFWGIIAYVVPESRIASLIFALFAPFLIFGSMLEGKINASAEKKPKTNSVNYWPIVKVLLFLAVAVFVVYKIVEFCGWFIATFGMVAFLLLLLIVLK